MSPVPYRLACMLAAAAAAAYSAHTAGSSQVEEAGVAIQLAIAKETLAISEKAFECRSLLSTACLPRASFDLPADFGEFMGWLMERGKLGPLYCMLYTCQVMNPSSSTGEDLEEMSDLEWIAMVAAIVMHRTLQLESTGPHVVPDNLKQIIVWVCEMGRLEKLSLNDIFAIIMLMLNNRPDFKGFLERCRDGTSLPSAQAPCHGVTGIPKRFVEGLGRCFPGIAQEHPGTSLGAVLDHHVSKDTIRAELRFYKYVLGASRYPKDEVVLLTVCAVYNTGLAEAVYEVIVGLSEGCCKLQKIYKMADVFISNYAALHEMLLGPLGSSRAEAVGGHVSGSQ